MKLFARQIQELDENKFLFMAIVNEQIKKINDNTVFHLSIPIQNPTTAAAWS
jgi:hypothetical protein